MQNETIVKLVQKANPYRHVFDLERRASKLLEEIGEASQAYLDVTSEHRSRNKTFDDVREEVADVLIVAIDIGLTDLPGETMPQYPTVLFAEHQTPLFISKLFTVTGALVEMEKALERKEWAAVRNYQNAMMFRAYALAITPLDDTVLIETALETEVCRKLDKWVTQRAARSA